MSARELVLGVNVGRSGTGAEVTASARAAEDAGFDVVTAPDHLGAAAPFGVLAMAAAATRRVRLRTYVLDVGFWNPALLAREAATLDALSGGRVELGLGAGHMRHEHVDAGLPFPPLADRVAGLERTLTELRRRLADPGHLPRPVQQPIPLVVGGWGEGTLGVAARHADVVALVGLTQVPGRRAGTFRLAGAAETAQRVGLLAGLIAGAEPGSDSSATPGADLSATSGVDPLAAAGADLSATSGADPSVPVRRRVVVDGLLQRVAVDRPPEQAAQEMVAESEGRFTVEELLDSPFLLLARDPAEAAAELLRRSRQYGITSWMTHAPSAGPFAEVLRELR